MYSFRHTGKSIIYIVAMQEADVPPSKKAVFMSWFILLIKSLALQMVSSEHMGLVNLEVA